MILGLSLCFSDFLYPSDNSVGSISNWVSPKDVEEKNGCQNGPNP